MRDINNSSEEEQINFVKKHWMNIKYISNPSEAVQLVAVKENGWSIEFIKNPSEQIQLAAIKQHSGFIKNIDNPSEAVQLEAVKNLNYGSYHTEEYVNIYITSEKAKQLYYKIKKVSMIIK